MTKQAIVGVSAIVVLLAVCLIGYAVYYNNQSCTIGYTGTAAIVTFQGGSSQGVCDRLVDAFSTHFYHYTSQPTGSELCEGTYANPGGNGSVHFIVRDTGLFNLAGNGLCTALNNSGNSSP